MGKTTAPQSNPPMPTSGGSYLREGDQLTAIEGTAPAEPSLATEPGLPVAAAPALAASTKE